MKRRFFNTERIKSGITDLESAILSEYNLRIDIFLRHDNTYFSRYLKDKSGTEIISEMMHVDQVYSKIKEVKDPRIIVKVSSEILESLNEEKKIKEHYHSISKDMIGKLIHSNPNYETMKFRVGFLLYKMLNEEYTKIRNLKATLK